MSLKKLSPFRTRPANAGPSPRCCGSRRACCKATARAAAEEIENLLIESLETARRQQALSWQLRTACDLVRLWQGQGRGEEALTLLQSIYDQCTEGSHTTDMIHAKALLEGLRANSVDKVVKDQTRATGSAAD